MNKRTILAGTGLAIATTLGFGGVAFAQSGDTAKTPAATSTDKPVEITMNPGDTFEVDGTKLDTPEDDSTKTPSSPADLAAAGVSIKDNTVTVNVTGDTDVPNKDIVVEIPATTPASNAPTAPGA